MRVCGIDPGNNGAICVLDSTDPTYIVLLDLAKTTIYEATKSLHHQNIDIVYLESVHSIFGMSAKSNFGFGRSVGQVTAIAEIVTRGTPPELVTPKKWQKFVGVTTKGKFIKKEVAAIATKLYPSAIITGARGGLLDGRSDALMICHYGLHHKD